MAILVTGSAGHLGEALMRTLLEAGQQPIGIDLRESAFTRKVGSIADRGFVKRCMPGVHAVLHTATLHKPHVASHSRQDFIDTNVTGTLYLIQKIGRDMRDRNAGRILITGSIAGYTPGAFQAVYHGTKAFIDSFSYALRNELKDTDVTVTCLMPGATETDFFDRAGLQDTKVGQAPKDNPADVAEAGFKAMMEGEADVITVWMNKLETTIANVTPNEMLAERTRKQYQPGSGKTVSK